MASMISSSAVTTVSRASRGQSAAVAPFGGLKSMTGFPVKKVNTDITSITSNGGRVKCMTAAVAEPRIVPRQTWIGLTLAGMIVAGWGSLHVYGVYFHRWGTSSLVIVPAIVAVQTWLSVGLFIVAHDAMHGSLAPGRPRLNAAVGRLTLGLYAGFRFDRLKTAHHAHHAAPGTADDPDFYAPAPRAFLPWFLNFFRTYFGWREMAVLTALVLIALFGLGARPANLLTFWAAPALLSALQLFTFGTWLPHRHTDQPFADAHHARSSGYGPVLSLLTCFHFGRHHEHHLTPWRPWWRLWRGES